MTHRDDTEPAHAQPDIGVLLATFGPMLGEWLAPYIASHLPADEPAEVERSGYLTPDGAAAYLGLKRKRIYDLKSTRVLVPDGHDGRTPLFRRETLDAYVTSSRRR